nr:uncharacterized protein LOC111417322 isoform X2 [Onthophagus taurus]
MVCGSGQNFEACCTNKRNTGTQIEIESESQLNNFLENTQSATIEILSSSPNESSVARKPIAQKLTSNFAVPKRVRKRTSSTDRTIQGLQEIVQKLDKKPKIDEDNEFDCFGKSVASSLKKLPESVALESMESIQSYLVRRRLSNTQYSEQISRPSLSASSSSYEYTANPCSNCSYDDFNLRFNLQQEQPDLLLQAINTSSYDDNN